MDKINKVRKAIDYRLTPADIASHREVKYIATRRAFAEVVKLDEIDSQDLFTQIHACFEENSHSRPYHDWYHTCCVVEGTIRGLRYHLSTILDNLSERQQKEVNSTVIAAAFHDVGHTGIREPDIVNVSGSIIIANRFLEDFGIHDKGTGSASVDVPFMLETLQSTQYPFKHEPLNEHEAILRDADLLQILEPTWFDDIYYNMYHEFIESNLALGFESFCINEKAFISNAKFYSIWFREQIQKDFSEIALARVNQVAVAVCG